MSTAETSPDLKVFVDEAVLAAFSGMAGLSLPPSIRGAHFPGKNPRVIGCVGIAGKIRGLVCLHVTEKFSRTVASAMLAIPADELDETNDINDVIGELTNIVAGKIKVGLGTPGTVYELSLPSIVRGETLELESISGAKCEAFTFSAGNEPVILEIYTKNPESQ